MNVPITTKTGAELFVQLIVCRNYSNKPYARAQVFRCKRLQRRIGL